MTLSSRIALIGIPLDDHSSFLKGAAQAPPLIRKAFHSDSSNDWTELGFNLGTEDVIYDAGDLKFTPTANVFAEIEQTIESLLESSLPVVSLGGDHSITYPIIKAFRKKYSRLSILHFDAHPDLYDELGGNRFSHASPFARICEAGLADRLVQIGIRALTCHQREQADRFGVEIHEMKDWRGAMDLQFATPVYLSIDMDCLDPAFAPGVSHHEPGGLSTREVIQQIHAIQAPIVGADIVEFNPVRDVMDMTAMTAAKLLKEVAGQILRNANTTSPPHFTDELAET
ncbi:MAG: agmatinase [Acidobacteriota bacterium]